MLQRVKGNGTFKVFLIFTLLFNNLSSLAQAEWHPFPIVDEAIIDPLALSQNQTITMAGSNLNQQFGWASSKTLCDINGDSINDLLIFANSAGTAKSAYVIFGNSAGFPSASIDINSLNGSNGFVINFTDDNLNYGATYVECLGDLNKDGTSEIGVGASFLAPQSTVSPPKHGTFYVIYGKKQGFASTLSCNALTTQDGFKVTDNVNYGFGYGFGKLGDINKDGYDDFAVSYGTSPSSCSIGSVAVIFGSSTFPSALSPSDLNGNNGFVLSVIENTNCVGAFGTKIAGDFDINKDGYKDILIGADWLSVPNKLNAGKGFVVFGRQNFPATLDPTTLNGTNGFQIWGETASGLTGFGVSKAGDFNGDGYDDVMLGSRTVSNGEGKVHIIYGANSFSSPVNLATLTPSQGRLFVGAFPNMLLGKVSYLEDINNSGYGAVGMGMWGGGGVLTNSSGKYWIYSVVYGGPQTATLANSFTSLSNNLNGKTGFSFVSYSDDYLGYSASPIGNFLGKGTTGMLIGSPKQTANGFSAAGLVFVISALPVGQAGQQCVNPATYCSSGKNCINTGTDYCLTSGNQCLNPTTYCPSGKNCINANTDYCATSSNQCVNPNTYYPSGKVLCDTGYTCLSPTQVPCNSQQNCSAAVCASNNTYADRMTCGNQEYVVSAGKNCIPQGTNYCATLGNQCVDPNTYAPTGTMLCAPANSSSAVVCGGLQYIMANETQASAKNVGSVASSDYPTVGWGGYVWGGIFTLTTLVTLCALKYYYDKVSSASSRINLLIQDRNALQADRDKINGLLQTAQNTIIALQQASRVLPRLLNDEQRQAAMNDIQIMMPYANNYNYPPQPQD